MRYQSNLVFSNESVGDKSSLVGINKCFKCSFFLVATNEEVNVYVAVTSCMLYCRCYFVVCQDSW